MDTFFCLHQTAMKDSVIPIERVFLLSNWCNRHVWQEVNWEQVLLCSCFSYEHLNPKLLNKRWVFWHPVLNKNFWFLWFYINYINCYILKSIHAKIIKYIWKFIRIVLAFHFWTFCWLKTKYYLTRWESVFESWWNSGAPQLFLIKKKLGGLDIHKNCNTNCFHMLFSSVTWNNIKTFISGNDMLVFLALPGALMDGVHYFLDQTVFRRIFTIIFG